MTESDRSAYAGSGRAVVFGPALVLTVTIEQGADGAEIHLHAGGQGFWIARLMAELGVGVTVVAPIGGEVGVVLSSLAVELGVALKTVAISGTNGAYVHDRRSGDRVAVADMMPTALSRHEVDDLYGAALVEALDADVCVLAGPGLDPVLSADIYERLASDLRANNTTVVADLSGECRRRALDGGVSVLKVSVEELRHDGRLTGDSRDEVVACAAELASSGAATVIVTRAGEGAVVASNDGRVLFVGTPPLQPVEHRGAGDSLTAGVAAGLAQGRSVGDALRLGAAAGALNVTRRGLGSGSRDEIERLAGRISLTEHRREG